jgi:hypothetical protein
VAAPDGGGADAGGGAVKVYGRAGRGPYLLQRETGEPLCGRCRRSARRSNLPLSISLC